ncbi:MAG TPA: transferase, partial [Patescibacteria group bacterium]|nr:transferase [Patescibacteria group bacterium]
MKSILIIGAGGLGKETVDLIRDIGGYEIAGFLDDNVEKKDRVINGVPVLDTVDRLEQYGNVEDIVIAIANPAIRRKIYEYSSAMGFRYPNLVHPMVVRGSNVKMGMGNIIYAYSILSTDVMLQDFVIINPQCGIGHESGIGSFTTLYWNVHVGGNTSILESCELGSKACVIQGLHVMDNVV